MFGTANLLWHRAGVVVVMPPMYRIGLTDILVYYVLNHHYTGDMKKDIYLPHLNYTIKVRPMKSPPEEMPTALAYVKTEDNNTCTMYLGEKSTTGDLLHEIIHVLQKICLARNIDFGLEQEHTAYIGHYLAGEILGYKWD